MKKQLIWIGIFLTQFILPSFSLAEEVKSTDNINLKEFFDIETDAQINIGSRGESVDLLKAKVPVDVVTAEQINRTGYTELTKVLQRFVAGFNFPRPSIKDGTDHIRPFTLRGMAPDQVLVLVNGKRLHASTLLHVNGTVGRGSTGVDLNTIPLRSIERIEILRDGAAAQYGSDAIAGIINIILKAGGEEHRLTTTVGQTYEGDGEVYQTDLHYGIDLPLDGFINITAELRDRNPTNRAITDGRQQYFDGDLRNNIPATQKNRRGDADTQDALFALNSELPLSDDILVYLHGSLNYRQSEAGAFFRRPLDNRNVRAIYPNGFLPLISPEIIDYSTSIGIKGELENDLHWELSHTIGGNRIDYEVKDSLNASLGVKSPTSFKAGGLRFRQHTTNLDLFREFDWGLKEPVNVAAGFEWRYETFKIIAGDEASHINGEVSVLDGDNSGQVTMAGAQGFPGFTAQNQLEKDRHNFSTYIDLDAQFNDKWSVGLSGRYEYYSDFGSAINGKFSLAYQVVDSVLLRGSASTGFRAPSLQQSFFNSTSSININNTLTSTSTLSVDDPTAQALGATSLEAEESQHLTLGFVFQPTQNLTFSADYFYNKINNRIIFSRNIERSISPKISDILERGNLSVARFFTNALDTQTQGFDLRANYNLNLNTRGKLKLSALYHYNTTEILGGIRFPSILGNMGGDIIFSNADRQYLESGQPSENLILMADYEIGAFNSAIKLIRAGSFSEEGQRKNSQWLADIDFSYQLNKHFNLGLGVHNLLDSEPKRNSQNGTFLQASPYGYNGGFYYMRLSVDFE